MEGLKNQVSVQITKKDLDIIIQKLNEAHVLLKPYVIALTAEERRQIPKMSDGNAPFVEKALEYAKSNPNLVPAFLKISEMDIDLKAVNDLSGVLRIAHRICSELDDTIMLSGSEAWLGALAFYNSVKMGTKLNVPGAKPVYEELSKRFEKRRSRTEAIDDQDTE